MSEPRLLSAIEDLIAACEAEMIGDTCVDEPDDAHVAYFMTFGGATPPCALTFGKIRRARAAIDAMKANSAKIRFLAENQPTLVHSRPLDEAGDLSLSTI